MKPTPGPVMIGPYVVHRFAQLVDMADQFELERLKGSIKANGLRQKPTLYNGEILDGRNRVYVMTQLGMPIEFDTFEGDEPAALQFALDMCERRDLNGAQRALMYQRAVKVAKEIAKRLQIERRQIRLPVVDPSDKEHTEYAQEHGTADLVVLLESGQIEASDAAAVAKLSEDEQKEWLQDRAKPVEPVRAKQEKTVKLETVAIELSPVDAIALKAGLVVLERSVHGEVRAAAVLLKRMCPCL